MIGLTLALALADQGLSVDAPPVGANGSLSVRVRVLDAGVVDRPELQLVVEGSVVPSTARQAVQDGLVTVLSFDGSGSFRAHHDRAFDLAEAFVQARAPQEAVGAMVFGRTARTWAPSADPDVVQRSLAEARAEGAGQPETRLGGFVREAVDLAATGLPPSSGGIRRVVLFTDAGEESGVFAVEELAEYARTRGVVVDAVVFVGAGRGSRAEDLDRVARLAGLTGGDVAEVGPSERPDLAALAAAHQGVWDVRAAWCGPSLPRVGVQGAAGLRADPRDAVGAVMPCAAEAPAPTPPTPSDPRPDPPVVDPGWAPGQGPADRVLGLLCLIGALGVFGLLAAVATLIARRAGQDPSTPAPASPVAPLPPEAPPEARTMSEVPPPVDSALFSTSLPETHLEVVGGDRTAGERWRFSGRILRVGASAEENDIVVELPQVSGRHARFELFPSGAVFVEDLGSANGTWLGVERLRPNQRVEVREGVRVALSSQLVVVVRKGGPR